MTPRDQAGGDPGVPPDNPHVLGAGILLMWGPLAWALLGAGAYMIQSPLCALDGPPPAPWLWALSALSLALALLGLALAPRLARLLLGPTLAPSTEGFLVAASRGLGLLSTFGILWLILAILILPDCPQMR